MYDIDLKNVKKGIGFYMIFFLAGLIFLSVFMYAMDEEMPFLAILLPGIFMCLGGYNIIKITKRITKIKKLNQTGTLFKNITYKLEDTGMRVNNNVILKPVVSFKMPSGEIRRLEGDPRHDLVERDEDGMIDLLIDLNDPENYYMDYSINRWEGNRPDDYYQYNESIKQELNKNNNQYGFNNTPNQYK